MSLESGTLTLKTTQGQVTVLNTVGGLLLANCYAAVSLVSGAVYTTRGGTAVRAGDGSEVRSRRAPLWPQLRWFIRLADEGAGLLFWLEVANTTALPLSIERLDVLVAPSGYCGARVESLRISQTGWQSWSPAWPPAPYASSGAQAPVAAPILPPTEADRMLVPWLTVLEIPRDRRLLAGFVTTHEQHGSLAIQPAGEGHRLTASAYLEGMTLAPGAQARSETLLLLFDLREEVALARYAECLCADMTGENRGEPLPVPANIAVPAPRERTAPTGWCSWYHYLTSVTEADVLRNVKWLASARPRLPVEYVQLDDGYQAEVGDWLTLNDKFPSGMPFLTQAIHGYGFKAGLWLAPFIVSERSRLYAEHPEWILADDRGRPVLAIWNWGSANYALDMTHPQASEWLTHLVTTIVDRWGYDYLKLDFVYAAALRGRHARADATSVQAYRLGLSTIRAAAGERYLVGCGAPFAPSLGLVDAMRVGPDVAPFWMAEREEDLAVVGLHRSARSTLAHAWMHGRLWTNDPDCVLLRAEGSALTLAEVQAWASLVALSGGSVMFSDDMSRLEPERVALARRLLPPLGEAALALGPVVDGIATRQYLAVQRDWGRWSTVALYNWSSEAASARFDPADWPDIPVPYHLVDLWSGRHWGPLSGTLDLDPIPPHGVCLLAVHADRGRPQVLGTSLHLLGGAVEWAGERWQNNRLTLSLRCPDEQAGTLLIYVPAPYELIGGQVDEPSSGRPGADGLLDLAAGREHAGIERRGRLLVVPVHLAGQADVSLPFELTG